MADSCERKITILKPKVAGLILKAQEQNLSTRSRQEHISMNRTDPKRRLFKKTKNKKETFGKVPTL